MKLSPTLRRSRLLVEGLELRRLLAASTFQFDAATYEFAATATATYLYIDRTGDDSTTETVDLATSNGTAVAGTDYMGEHYTATFNPNVDSMPIPISLLNPGAAGPAIKTFTVNLSNPTGGASLGSPSTTTVTIDEPLAMTGTTTTVTAATNAGPIPVTSDLSLGTNVTFTARVARTHLGIAAPTGTITFSIDGVAQPAINLTASDTVAFATADFTTSTLPVGPHTITAAYSGDSSATVSTGSTSVTVAQATTVSLQTPTQAAAQGQPVTFTANVTAASSGLGTPTGTFTFNIYGGRALPGEMISETATVPLVASSTIPGLATASYTTSDVAVGGHDVSAIYNGDATFAPNTASGAALIGHPTTTVITAFGNPSTPGQPVTLTALVTGTSSQNPLVEGDSSELGFVAPTVTFTIDGVTQTPVTITAAATNPLVATAQFISPALAIGTHQISAVFNDGSNVYNAPSVGTLSLPTAVTTISSPLNFVPTQTTLAITPTVPVVGRPFIIIATVAGAAPLPTATPTGTVEFFDDGTLVAILPLNGNGQAALFLPALAAGPHGFNVVYSGDASNAGNLAAVAPVVASVQRATARNTTSLVLSIGGGALDSTSAQTVSNYQLTGPQSRSVKVRSATYNAAAATVTLRLASALNLRSTYQLQVIGTSPSGLRGTNGSFLGGNAGFAGTNYQTVVNSSTPVRSRVQVRAATAHPQARLATLHQAATRSAHARITR